MLHLTIGPDGPSFLGVDLGLWLNAASILVAVMIAAIVSPLLSSRSTKREKQERVLRTMLNTWQTPANADWQLSLALILLDFKGCHKILAARDGYLALVNVTAPAPQEELAARFEAQKAAQAKLIAAIADKLNFDITAEGLLKGAYISQGFVDREMLIVNAWGAWSRIATALERNNEMFAAQIGPPSPQPEGSNPPA